MIVKRKNEYYIRLKKGFVEFVLLGIILNPLPSTLYILLMLEINSEY